MTPGANKGRIITSLIGVLAMIGPVFGDDIISWLVTCNEMAVGAVFIPIIVAVFTKKKTLPREAGWGAFVLGSIGTIFSMHFQESIIGALFPFLLSGLGFYIGSAYALKWRKKCVVTE